MTATLLAALAVEHRHDLHRSAAREQLAQLARCCRPSTWRGLLRRQHA